MTNEGDEEVEYSVFLNFGSHFPFDDFLDDQTEMKIIGLDCDTPIAQINGRFYQGEYDLAVGTKLFFAQTDEPDEDEWFGKKNQSEPWEYVDKTNKVLNMKRIFITQKKKETEEPVKEEKNNQKYHVETTYGEALNKFLPEFRDAPRTLPSEEYNLELLQRTKEVMDET